MKIRKPITALVAVTAALLGAAAAAEPLPKAATAQAARCTAVIRPLVRDAGTTLIRHTITAVRTVGARREFTIESAVYGAASPEGRSFVSRCLAERWGDGAELKSVQPVPFSPGTAVRTVARHNAGP